MAGGRFGATTVIDRPIEAVFAYLADGENDPKFSSRVLEIRKTTDGPPGVGTVYASTVKDGGVKFKREFKLTEFEPPTRIRWSEISTGPVETPEGGYDLSPQGEGTQLTQSKRSAAAAFGDDDSRPQPLGAGKFARVAGAQPSAGALPADGLRLFVRSGRPPFRVSGARADRRFFPFRCVHRRCSSARCAALAAMPPNVADKL